MHTVEIIISGFLLGLITTVPFGAVGAFMFKQATDEGFDSGMLVGILGVVADFIYLLLVFLGIGALIANENVTLVVQGIGILLLIYFGYKDIFKKRPDYGQKYNFGKKRRHLKIFSFIVVYTFSNPTRFAFWISIVPTLNSLLFRDPSAFRFKLLFSVLFFVGAVVMQYISLKGVLYLNGFQKIKNRIDSGIVALYSFSVLFLIYYYILQVKSAFY